MQEGRLVYIEPNDIVKDHIEISNIDHKNFTWNPEDLNLYVDLQVVLPNRNDCGEEPESKNGTYKNTYISLMEGTKIGNNGSLTTDYTNISYNEIDRNNVSSKEALGITSIDITFDAHFYPKVTINFTDVRAYSLFMPAEEEYKSELETQAYESYDDNGNRKYHKQGKAYTNFFNAVFHFPYPRFLLTVKGFYGTKVTFILAVETFKSALNSNTGNFDISINFIGYMYGIYTDIPMNLLICAPYIGTLSTNSEDSLLKSEYWNYNVTNGTFTTKSKEGTTEIIPTFLEFAKKYAIVLNNIKNNTEGLGEAIVDTSNITELISKIDEIINQTKNLILNNFGMTGDEKDYYSIVNTEGGNGREYVFFIFHKTNTTENTKALWLKSTVNTLKDLIDNTNQLLERYLENEKITYPSLFTETTSVNNSYFSADVIGRLSDVKDNKDNESVVLGNSITYDLKNSDTQYLKRYIENKLNNNTDNYYYCAIGLHKYITNLTNIQKELINKKNKKQGDAHIDAEKYISRELGFTPSIENIFRMTFAHLQCFFHEYIDRTINEIKDERNSGKRLIGNFKPVLNRDNTDIKYKDNNGRVFAPPFFAYYQMNDNKKEVAYPGNYNIKETQLVESILQAARRFAEEYAKVVSEIEELSTTTTEYQEEVSHPDNFELPISYDSGFTISSYYDVFYGNRNPYSYLNQSSTKLLKDIFYLFIIRFYANLKLGVKNINYSYIHKYMDNEIKNILAVFPDLKKETFNLTFVFGKDKIYDSILEYSKNKIVPIEKILDNYINVNNDNKSISDMLLLTRHDISEEHTEYSRKEFFDKNENAFDFLKGVKIVDSQNFDIFNSIKTSETIKELHDNIVYDNIEYIRVNKWASKCPIHKLYKSYSNSAEPVYRFTDIDVPQLPCGDEINQCTLPFIIWGTINGLGNNVYRNLLYDIANGFEFQSGHNIKSEDIICQSFFILASLIVDITDIRNKSFNSGVNNLNGDFCDVKITLTRKIIVLFYGCLMYLLRVKLTKGHDEEHLGPDIVPSLIHVDTNNEGVINKNGDFKIKYNFKGEELNAGLNKGYFDYEYDIAGLTDNEHNRNVRNLLKQLICVNDKNKITTATIPSNINNEMLINFFKGTNNELTDLEKLFIQETKDGGILKEIIDCAKLEKGNVQTVKPFKIKYKNGVNNKVFGDIVLYPYSGKTSNAIVRLMSETVCMISTNYVSNILIANNVSINQTGNSYNQYIRHEDNKYFVDTEKIFKTFWDKLYNACSDDKIEQQIINYQSNTTNQTNLDIQRSLYYTLKNIYDKWVCSYGDMERFKLGTIDNDNDVKKDRFKKGIKVNTKREINNFVFVDSLYRDIGKDFICDPSSLIKLTQISTEGEVNNFSVYQFLHQLCSENKLLMRAIPVYNNFYTEEGLKEIFTPKDVFNINQGQENGFSSTYLIMYTHQPSAHLNTENSDYLNDGLDIGRTIVTNDTKKIFGNTDNGYIVPSFAVTYGMQNQNYFKSINVNMDNPITTDYSIANQLMISQTAASSGDLNLPVGIGQNIYSIYSNRSYTCTVEMMGCANIMPMMYFQLNNIPMFKGAYMITSVKHSIRNGNMTTVFTGVRQTSIIYPFVNSSLILNAILDKIQGPINNDVTKVEFDSIDDTPNTNSNTITSSNSDITIVKASLIDEEMMKEMRDYYRKNPNNSKIITNTNWGSTNKGKSYPLNYNQNRTVKYIILHYAGGTSSRSNQNGDVKRSPAYRMCHTFFNRWQNGVSVSADYSVDDDNIVQFTPDPRYWEMKSCPGNKHGIAIEMCNDFVNITGAMPYGNGNPPNRPQFQFSEQVLNNTKKLIIEIFKEFGPLNITTHYIRDRKNGKKQDKAKPCPGIYGWNLAPKYDENGVKLTKSDGSTYYNDESELDKFINDIWDEWVRVANENNLNVGNKITKESLT